MARLDAEISGREQRRRSALSPLDIRGCLIHKRGGPQSCGQERTFHSGCGKIVTPIGKYGSWTCTLIQKVVSDGEFWRDGDDSSVVFSLLFFT